MRSGPPRLLIAGCLVVGAACGASLSPTASTTGPQYLLLRGDGIAAAVREHRTVSPRAAARSGRMEFGYRWTRAGEIDITISPGFVCFAAPCGVTLAGIVTDSTLRLVQSEPVTRVFHSMRLPAADGATTGR